MKNKKYQKIMINYYKNNKNIYYIHLKYNKSQKKRNQKTVNFIKI